MRNYLLGVLLLILAFYLLWEQGSRQLEYPEQTAPADSSAPTELGAIRDLNSSSEDFNLQASSSNGSSESVISFPQSLGEEKFYEGLQTNLSSMTFSNHTGGIRSIELFKSDRLNKAYEHKLIDQPFLGMAFEDDSGRVLVDALPDPRGFRLLDPQNTQDKVTYRWESPGKISIDRTYERLEQEGYLFRHRIVVRNLSDSPIGYDNGPLERVRLYLGSSFQIPRMYNPFDQASTYLSVGYFNDGVPLDEGCSCATCSGRIDGEREEFFQLNELGPSGRIQPRELSKVKWACINNQFFVNLLRPESELNDFRVWAERAPSRRGQDGEELVGISGAVSFPLGTILPNGSKEFAFEVYAGPKDYAELAKFADEQRKVMQFGIFWWISEPLSWSLDKLSALFGSYGFGIVVLTILVKLLLWPLTAQATRSQKKMQALQGPLGKLREKHKGNPQKLNQEMMKFYKENKVNPFAGCWPILVQIPIFLGMFWMLRSAAELYGQEFLWAQDLSEQDSIAMLSGFSLNLLPIFMVVTQWYQMRLNPMQLGPEMSEAQRINAKMMRFMPFMFLVFLYFFSSALVLYWTTQNLMTILQTLLTKNTAGSTSLPQLEEEKNSSPNSSGREKGSSAMQDDVDDEEKKLRNYLGLKGRGRIDPMTLESRYRERMKNYTPARLKELSEGKRAIAEEKRNKITEAYEVLKNGLNKEA